MNQPRDIKKLAEGYISLGWSPIPLNPKGKSPSVKWKKWDAKQEGLKAFGADANIGIKLGEPSNNLFDMDLDWGSAARLAERLFPELPSFGRSSNPSSHRVGYFEGDLKTFKFELPAGSVDTSRLPITHSTCILELRSTGGQTMFPGSVHPSGESVAWDGGEMPSNFPRLQSEELTRRAGLCAFLAFVLHLYPAEGTRHHMHMALAGVLVRAGRTEDETNQLCITVAELAGDEEASKRGTASCITAKLAQNDPVTGLPRLMEILDVNSHVLHKRLSEWLGLKQETRLQNNDIAQSQSGLDITDLFYAAEEFRTRIFPNFIRYKETNYQFNGQFYEELVQDEFSKILFKTLAGAYAQTKEGIKPIRRTPDLVKRLQTTIHAEAHLNTKEDIPLWKTPNPPFDAAEILNLKNGLLHVPTGRLIPHTPDLLTLNGVNFDYEPNATEPKVFLNFLNELWPDPSEKDNIQTLQEIFGYLLVNQTHHHKIFFIYGPPRSGKGTLSEVLTQLIGPSNVVSPSLNGLGDGFGLQSLIGKQLAIMSDVRMSGKVDKTVIGENLLRISGEDAMDIQRKYERSINMRLKTRILMMGNELPQFSDSSTALIKRFVILRMRISHYGKEDLGLKTKLLKELSGILNWAIEGYRRLSARGYFITPESGKACLRDMEEAAAPVAHFLKEFCDLDPKKSIPSEDLYQAYSAWGTTQGRTSLNAATFGRRISEANLDIKNRQRSVNGHKVNYYVGVDLKKEEKEQFSTQKEKEEGLFKILS